MSETEPEGERARRPWRALRGSHSAPSSFRRRVCHAAKERNGATAAAEPEADPVPDPDPDTDPDTDTDTDTVLLTG